MRILGLLLLVFLTVGCGTTGERPDATTQGSGDPSQTAANSGDETTVASMGATSETAPWLRLRTVTINASNGENVKVRVEIADTVMSRFVGLRGRESLPEDRGMLFVYAEEEKRSYTMDDTLIPLSIAFMDSEGRIVDIQDMQPLEEGPYVSAEPAQYALEVNKGFFEERGVEVGDKAELPV